MQETDSLHLLTEHPIILFIIGAIFVLGLLFLVAKIAARYFDRNRADRERRK